MKMSYKRRKELPKKDFAVPSKRKGGKGGYPVATKAKGRNALARVAQHGSPAEKKEVRAKVHKKFPSIDSGKKSSREKRLEGKTF